MAIGLPRGWQVENINGTPVSGAKIYTWVDDGVTTPRSLYTDKDCTVPAANPIVADSAGWWNVYQKSSESVHIVVKSADDSITYTQKTYPSAIDNAQPVDATLTALAGLTIADGDIIEGTGADAFRVTKRTVATLAALQAITSPQANDLVYMQGRASAGDGGGGYFMFDSSDLSTEVAADEVTSSAGNGGVYIALGSTLDGSDGAWVRLFDGSPDPKWYGAKLDATINASGTLSGTDDAAALNKWLSILPTYGYHGEIRGSFRIDSQLSIPEGVTVDCLNHSFECPRYRVTNTSYEKFQGNVCYVNFGGGEAADDYDNMAWMVEDRACLKNLAFWYPGQDMSETTTPTVFPAAIGFVQTAHSATIENIQFGNAYVGFDLWRDHTNCNIVNVRGWPIFKGGRIGSQGDKDYVHTVHWHPLHVYRGTITSANSLAGYINENCIGLELGAQSWTQFSDCFAYGLFKHHHCTYQPTGTGQTIAGGCENIRWVGGGADACYYGGYWTNNSQSGNTHFGITYLGFDFAPYDVYNSGNDNSRALYVSLDSSAGLADFTVIGGRVHAGREHAFEMAYVKGLQIQGTRFVEFGEAGSGGDAIRLSNCQDVRIDAYFDGQSNTSVRALRLVTGCANVDANLVCTGMPSYAITVASSSNTYYAFGGTFDQSTQPLEDLQLHDESRGMKREATWDAEAEFYDDDDIDNTTNILTLPAFGTYFAGSSVTETVEGINQRYKGAVISLRGNSGSTMTIAHQATGVGTAIIRILPKAANYTVASNELLTITSSGSAWHVERA